MKTIHCIAICLIIYACSSTQSNTEQVDKETDPNEPAIIDSVTTAGKETNRIKITDSGSENENITAQARNSDTEKMQKDEQTFMNFIAQFKESADVSGFVDEGYYFSFMQQNYGSPVQLQHLVDAGDLQVFRAKYGESEVEADNVWVYNRSGEQLSMCHLPSSQIGIEVKQLIIDTLSLEPIRLHIDSYYIEYEVNDDLGAPERGAMIKEVSTQYEIAISEAGDCNIIKGD